MIFMTFVTCMIFCDFYDVYDFRDLHDFYDFLWSLWFLWFFMAGHIQIVFKKRVFEGLFHASFFFLLGVLNHFLVGWLVGFTPQHPPPSPPLPLLGGLRGPATTVAQPHLCPSYIEPYLTLGKPVSWQFGQYQGPLAASYADWLAGTRDPDNFPVGQQVLRHYPDTFWASSWTFHGIRQDVGHVATYLTGAQKLRGRSTRMWTNMNEFLRPSDKLARNRDPDRFLGMAISGAEGVGIAWITIPETLRLTNLNHQIDNRNLGC